MNFDLQSMVTTILVPPPLVGCSSDSCAGHGDWSVITTTVLLVSDAIAFINHNCNLVRCMLKLANRIKEIMWRVHTATTTKSEFWMVGCAWTEPIAVSHGQTYWRSGIPDCVHSVNGAGAPASTTAPILSHLMMSRQSRIFSATAGFSMYCSQGEERCRSHHNTVLHHITSSVTLLYIHTRGIASFPGSPLYSDEK